MRRQSVEGSPSWEALLAEIHEIRPADEYVVQQLALVTDKGKQPDTIAALQQARSFVTI